MGEVMDDLDREIEVAARAARQRVWRGRIATIASTATFFLVGIRLLRIKASQAH